jgi:hypothetical protein
MKTTPEITELLEEDCEELHLVHSAASGYSSVLSKSEAQILKQVEDTLVNAFGAGCIERVNTDADRLAWMQKARETNDPSLRAGYLALAEGDA